MAWKRLSRVEIFGQRLVLSRLLSRTCPHSRRNNASETSNIGVLSDDQGIAFEGRGNLSGYAHHGQESRRSNGIRLELDIATWFPSEASSLPTPHSFHSSVDSSLDHASRPSSGSTTSSSFPTTPRASPGSSPIDSSILYDRKNSPGNLFSCGKQGYSAGSRDMWMKRSCPTGTQTLFSRTENCQVRFLARGGAWREASTDASTVRELPTATRVEDEGSEGGVALEVTPEARRIFEDAWQQVLVELGGEENLVLPREIVWLNGAPGAGKGANTPFILKTRGFGARAIQVSDLLQSTHHVANIMRAGGLVSDTTVLSLLLKCLLNLSAMPPEEEDGDHGEPVDSGSGDAIAGAVIDGFPRTTVQVDLVKLLYDRLMDLHQKFLDSPLEGHYPRPIFRIAVLYVEEEESIRRQLARGRAAIAHNQRVKDSGFGAMREVRHTDLCEQSARRRYEIFREHYGTLLRLKAFFPFHLVDAMGTLNECREQIEKELQYQSALELNATTFRAISHIPLASDIAKYARQNLVMRLESYEKHAHDLFLQVVDVIDDDVMPIIRRCALSGVAVYNTERSLFFSSPVAAEILADILSERGYYVTWQTRTREIPIRVNPETLEVTCARRTTMQFRIEFERPQIRNSLTASTPIAAPAPPPVHAVAQSVPSHEVRDPEPQSHTAKRRACPSLPGGASPCFVPDCPNSSSEQPAIGSSSDEEGSGWDGEKQQQQQQVMEIPGLKGGGIRRPEGCGPAPDWVSEAAVVREK